MPIDAVYYLGTECGPGYQPGKALLNFLKGFGAEGTGSFGGCCRGVGTIGDGLVQLVEGPVGWDFHGAALGAKVLQHWACRVGLCKGSRVHQTMSGNMSVRLTLGFCENGMDVGEGDGVKGLGKVGVPEWGAAKPGGVGRSGDAVGVAMSLWHLPCWSWGGSGGGGFSWAAKAWACLVMEPVGGPELPGRCLWWWGRAVGGGREVVSGGPGMGWWGVVVGVGGGGLLMGGLVWGWKVLVGGDGLGIQPMFEHGLDCGGGGEGL